MKRQLVIALICLPAASVFGDVTTWMNDLTAWHAQARTAMQARMQPAPAVPAPRAARLLPPPNDNFAASIELVNDDGAAAGDTTEATMEPGEPWHADYFGTNSIWWSWKAPYDGVFGFDTFGSGTSAKLMIYSGSALVSLTRVAQAPNRMFSATLVATAGVTYQIAVCGAESADQGAVQVRYYPQIISDPFVFQVATNEHNTPLAAPDGSVCFAPGATYITYNVRSNTVGVYSELALGYSMDTLGVTIRTKAGTVLLNNAPLPGISNPYAVHDYNGRALLAYEYNSGRLVLFKVSRHGLQNVAEQIITSPAALMSVFTAKDIRLMFMEMSLLGGQPRLGVTAYNKQLRRQLWSLPLEEGGIDHVTAPQGVFCRSAIGLYTVAATVYKKGVALYTQTITLPPAPEFGEVRTESDTAAGLLFWTAQDGADYSTNGPVSYLDKKGHTVINALTFPDTDNCWSFGASNGKIIYLARPDGLNISVIAYQIGAVFVELARQPFASFDEVLLTGGTATIMLRDDNPPPTLNGMVQYDKRLRREKWNNPLTRGDELNDLGHGVFNRTAYEPMGATTNIMVNIFNRRGTLADHTLIY